MKAWIVRGAVNDGRDGLPNNPEELTWTDFYSGYIGFPRNHEEAVFRYLFQHKVNAGELRFAGCWRDMNGNKYHRYIAEIANGANGWNYVEREFLSICKVCD